MMKGRGFRLLYRYEYVLFVSVLQNHTICIAFWVHCISSGFLMCHEVWVLFSEGGCKRLACLLLLVWIDITFPYKLISVSIRKAIFLFSWHCAFSCVHEERFIIHQFMKGDGDPLTDFVSQSWILFFLQKKNNF